MIVVRLDRRPRATNSDSESLRRSRPWQMSMVQRVETAWTAAATVFITAARIAATTSPCPAAPSGFCRPKIISINRRPLCFRREAAVARRAEFHRRRQARQDEIPPARPTAASRPRSRPAGVPFASCPQAALQRQRADGRVPEPDRQREGNHAEPGKHAMMRRQKQRSMRRGVRFPDGSPVRRRRGSPRRQIRSRRWQ